MSRSEVAVARQQPGFAAIDLRVPDVRDGAAVTALVASLVRLDVLVNCAGAILRAGAEHDPEVFAEILDINLSGTMRLCAAARSKLAAQRGCIINTTSRLSFFGGGLVPGWIATPLTQPLHSDPARSDPIGACTPLGRWGTPQDGAGPVLFLASPDAQFVTGVILLVDGDCLMV